MIDQLLSLGFSFFASFSIDSFLPFCSEPLVIANFWLWQFFGRLHPMIVHFPIGLLVVVLFLELYSLRGRKNDLRPAINLLLILGALSAGVAVAFGWFLKVQDDYSGELLDIHQWVGIATAVLAVITAYLHQYMWSKQRSQLLNVYRSVLIFSVLGVAVAGHYGAELTHGEDFLTEVLPWQNETIEGNPDFDINQLASYTDVKALSPKQIVDLNLEVRAIFAHNCYKCHSSAKIKGDLRLDGKKYVMKGGESGDVLSVGHPEKSEMIRRLLLPREDEESMPPKGKSLADDEIATLKLWIKLGAPWPDSLDKKSVFRVAELAPRNPAVPEHDLSTQNEIDAFVNAYFEEKKIRWPEVVEDNIYIRRVYLDIIGLLPSPDEIDVFVKDQSPGKREQLVKELLSRDADYAQHWLSFWNDALRNDYSGTGYITGGRFAITDWLYESLKENKPYDQFVQQLISPDERSSGFIRGIRWRGTVNASQRVEMQAAQNVSQVFLGLNLKCASCHDSFVSDWTLKQAYEFANIFADSALEISRCDVPTGEFAGTKILFTELGEIDSTYSVEEKLKQLADFLTAPKNGRLYRTIVNRMWGQLMGRGIVAPTDLMDNIPWSQELLDWLAYDFAVNGKDMKDLIFKITTSKTYQLPTVELKSESELLAEDYVFKGMHRRRLSAEQFADAVSTIIFPIYPDSLRFFHPNKDVIGSQDYIEPVTHFVRASLVKNDPFLTALGRPNRENVLTSRSTEANLLQALEVTNGERFNMTLQHGAEKWREEYPEGEELIENLYMKALGRKPLKAEVEAALKALGDNPEADQIEDLLWSVMLLPEFQLIY
jgi:uncharacterized membrane protein